MCVIWVICFVTLKRSGRSFCWTGACLGENKACLSPQRHHGGPAAPGPGRAGRLLARRRSARLSAGEDLPRGALLPEAARREQREQGDPGPGHLRLHLPHADGNTQLVKNPPAVWETWVRSIHGLGRSPGEGNGYPL